MTNLHWDHKTDEATVHDKDNRYTWSAAGPGSTIADGTVFTSFLATLNESSCFAGHCDWRLPTVYEVQTILFEPCPAPNHLNPCIDQSVFGPLFGNGQWSATTFAVDPRGVWSVIFADDFVSNIDSKGFSLEVRAVRGGL